VVIAKWCVFKGLVRDKSCAPGRAIMMRVCKRDGDEGGTRGRELRICLRAFQPIMGCRSRALRDFSSRYSRGGGVNPRTVLKKMATAEEIFVTKPVQPIVLLVKGWWKPEAQRGTGKRLQGNIGSENTA